MPLINIWDISSSIAIKSFIPKNVCGQLVEIPEGRRCAEFSGHDLRRHLCQEQHGRRHPRGPGRQFCVIFYLGPFFGCIFGPFFGPFLELEYLGLGGVETYDLFKNPFGALFGAFFRALFNDTELTPRAVARTGCVSVISLLFPNVLQGKRWFLLTGQHCTLFITV